MSVFKEAANFRIAKAVTKRFNAKLMVLGSYNSALNHSLIVQLPGVGTTNLRARSEDQPTANWLPNTTKQ